MNKFSIKPFEASANCNNWGLSRSFYYTVSEQGVTNAAKALGISQPSASAALQRLEKRLDQTLVQRGQRQFELTAAGKVLFGEVEKMFDASLRAEEKLKALHSDLIGHVQLHLVTGARSELLDEVLRLMHQRHPSVLLEIQIASSPTIQSNVISGAIPFGVCLMFSRLSRLDCQLLLSAEYGLFCGAENALFGQQNVPLSELQDLHFIAFSCDSEGSASEPMIALRNNTGIGRYISGTSGDFAEVCRMIIAGLGIGLLPIHAVKREIEDESLWRVDLPGPPLYADMFFISDPERALSDSEAIFLSIVQEVVAMEVSSEHSVQLYQT